MAILTASGISMPCPVSLKIGDEIIWSSNTGRGSNGTMTGDVVATKQDIEITWAFLRDSDLATIKRGMPRGFFNVSFRDAGSVASWKGYRDTITSEDIGDLGDGKGHCYRSVTTKVIQQ